MNTVGQYPELMSAMKSYNENHDFEKVSNQPIFSGNTFIENFSATFHRKF